MGEKGLKDIKLYLAFLVSAVIMVLSYPGKGVFRYQYQTGRPWIYETLIADFDFPILKTQEQLMQEREEKASQVLDYYEFEDGVSYERLSAFNRQYGYSDRLNAIYSILEDAYSRGIVPSFPNDGGYDGKVIFVKKGKRAKEMPASEVYTVDQVFIRINSSLAMEHSQKYADSLCESIKIRDYIVPNLKFDEVTSNLMHKEAIDYISPTIGTIYTGQLIVSNGEIVTVEIKQLLDSYRSEYNASLGLRDSDFMSIMEHILIVAVLLLFLFAVMYFTDKSMLASYKNCLFILLLQVIMFLAIVVVEEISPELMYILPLSIYVLYTMAFFKPSFVYPSYLVVIMPVLLLCDNGVDLFMMNAAAGGVLLFSYPKFNRGWGQFLNALFIFITLLVVHVALNLNTERVVVKSEVVYMALHSVLLIIFYPFVFLLERMFGLVSKVRLWELTDTNNDLLRDLAHKAPGTFQHCLQVANLAEEAAEKLGADTMLVRAGALYHDIGKMDNPQCFIENQAAGVDYHSGLSPEESAAAIIRHVDDGYARAKKSYLPDIVSDFIVTHHGDSITAYFYRQYCNAGGDPADKAAFKYHGKLPQTREQAIVMICDTVEAASRTLDNYSHDSISGLVDKLVQAKLAEGQLREADISFKEILIVKECIVDRLMQIYHARIAYPPHNVKRKKK